MNCDHCGEPLSVDANGYYVGDDGTSDCRVSDDGHTVDGQVREP